MHLEELCRKALYECRLLPGACILVALSGGMDSVALLHVLCDLREEMNFSLCAAHYNHCLRGEASRADAQFARKLCREMGIPIVCGEGDVRALAATLKTGPEDAARRARYAFLEEAAKTQGAQYIALAHHLDDQAETVLLHAVRGSDVRGLRGMTVQAGNRIRPLLEARKEDIQTYITQKQLPYCTDESNASAEYDRNRLRLNVFDELKKINPRVHEAFARLAQSAQRDEAYFEKQMDNMALSPYEETPYGGYFDLGALTKGEEALNSRIIARYFEAAGMRCFGASDVHGVMALWEGARRATMLGGGVRAERCESRIHLILKEAEPPEALPLTLAQGKLSFGGGDLQMRPAVAGERGDGRYMQVLDAEALDGAVIRTRKEGDRFHPLGMQGSRKLKQVFIDAKVDRPFRDHVPLLAKGDEVLWIIGLRPAQTASVTEKTRQAIHFTWTGQLPYVQKTT